MTGRDDVALSERAAARSAERARLLEARDRIDAQLGQLAAADAADRELTFDDIMELRAVDPRAVVDVLARPPSAAGCPIRDRTLELRHHAPADLRRWTRDGLRLARRVAPSI